MLNTHGSYTNDTTFIKVVAMFYK